MTSAVVADPLSPVESSPGVKTLESVAGMTKEGREIGRWSRVFTKDGVHPFDDIEWKRVDAVIARPDGTIVFEQKGIEVPSWWTETTINIVADKYFRMIDNVRENSVKQIISRVASTLTKWAFDQGYFESQKDADIYEQELIYALLHQFGAFNSPVWFNLGVPGRRQAASACFISGVGDSLDSISEFQKSEKIIFAGGSGSGANFSALRSSYEKLSSGAYVCGPLGFMEECDKGAKVMKSGGSTRNAAKIVVIDIDHPDIIKTKDGRPGFITCKAVEEKRAHDLIDIGYSASYDDPNSAYKWVSFQNANHSVSISDEFMKAVADDRVWETKARITGSVVGTYKAKDVWLEIAKAAWFCGDPGVQYSDTINKWHTTPNSGRIRSSNPCAEFLHVDNTACNLCALNLTKFFDGRVFNVKRFEHAIRIFVTAQNAVIAKAEYPTPAITKNSLALRPIGLNYGNLGALLMNLGFAYDSDEGRVVAARLASLMTANAYIVAAKLAARTSPFAEFEKNKEPMFGVMKMHREVNKNVLKRWDVVKDPLGDDVLSTSEKAWDEAIKLGEKHGYSISQATLQAPLGTVSFLMDMDTTGIEPAFSLVSYKSLVGGGSMKLVSGAVKTALYNLGYSVDEVAAISQFLIDNDDIEGAPFLKAEHLPIFECAMPSKFSGRCVAPVGHLKMMAAIQPLITCAQSKTVNLKSDATVEDIATLYYEGWKLGLKCIALYRDGCKKSQPLKTKDRDEEEAKTGTIREVIVEVPALKRQRLPKDVTGFRHKFYIGGHKVYLMVNEYADGTPGEIFIRLGKNGSTLNGLLDGFTMMMSIALQHGTPLPDMVKSFIHQRFEPSGMTDNPQIRFADSIYDYVFKYLDIRYCGGKNSGLAERIRAQAASADSLPPPTSSSSALPVKNSVSPTISSDAPPCMNCGAITQRVGTCYLCVTCGVSTGCS
jgi:ribonucleoside-diphosphate reductase alpha chain